MLHNVNWNTTKPSKKKKKQHKNGLTVYSELEVDVDHPYPKALIDDSMTALNTPLKNFLIQNSQTPSINQLANYYLLPITLKEVVDTTKD